MSECVGPRLYIHEMRIVIRNSLLTPKFLFLILHSIQGPGEIEFSLECG